ncbi:hypothetical protein R3W88_033391 [Solanum pinnatisectum]|uniref:Retrotransposon gag domain-containing protein n=1 Tax=Solanum pinnatisectum TaxID=50273 RepID=A0AAV9K4B5_9SOLN|nr:hypothetical protein R3W88_033391 [Solanum pinnatisectum]
MYEAWMSEQALPSSIPNYLNTNMPPPIQVSTNDPIYPPGFDPYANTSNVDGTSMARPFSTPMMNKPLFMSTAPTKIVPQSIMEPKSHNDPPPKNQYDRDYTAELTFKISNSYPHTHQYSSPVEVEKAVKNEEHEEMTRKIKSFEQSVRDMQGLGGHRSKYDGHGDTVAQLKRYCNQPRGARSKEELLMAYFGESLMGIASKWFIDQDTSNWHTWDDLARFPDRTSLASMRKKTTESFHEYAIRWREQAARVKPPMKESEMINVFLHAQEPDYLHYLLSVVGKTFTEVIKIREIVENDISLEIL